MHWIKLPPAAARSSSGAMPARIASSRTRHQPHRFPHPVLVGHRRDMIRHPVLQKSRARPLISGSSRVHSFQDLAFQDLAFQDLAFQIRIPRSRIPRSRIPRSRIPRSRIPRSRIPRSRIQRSRIPRSRIPKISHSKISHSKISHSKISVPRFCAPRVCAPEFSAFDRRPHLLLRRTARADVSARSWPNCANRMAK